MIVEGGAPEGAAETPSVSTSITHAGIALQAADTGRVLLLQRSLADAEDPNKGLWEFPGGGLDEGENPLAGAKREFGEEVGVALPNESHEGPHWDLPPNSPNYRLYRMMVPNESVIDLNSNEVQNPDDPRGLDPESVAWWEPTHIEGAAIRPEVLDAMQTVNFGQTEEATVPEDLTAAVPPQFAKKAEEPKAATVSEEGDVEEEATEPVNQAVDVLEQVEAALRGEHDPAQVAELVVNARKILTGDDEDVEVTAADALTASAAPALIAPPDEWFQPFDLGGPTPLTVTADGRVFGHLATWDSCHRSGQYGTCTRPPSDPNAPFFKMGQVVTASGAAVDVGVVTVGGGHASADKGLMAAIEHYDDVSTAAATVTVHEDDYGIGLFGSVTPGTTPEQVAALRRSPLSGDWRKEKGTWRLVAAHAVNTPGFPIPRGLVASVVEDKTYIVEGRPEPKQPTADLRLVARRLAKSAGLDTQSLVASFRASMSEVDCGCDDEEPALVAAVSGDTSLPVAPYDREWDGGEAAARVFDFYTKDGVVDTEAVGKAFLWRDDKFPADKKAGWSLPFADIVDGSLKIVVRGVHATASGHGVGQLGVSAEDKAAIKGRISALYAHIKEEFPDAPDSPFVDE